MALRKFRHLVPVQYSNPSASFSSSPLATTIFCMWRPSRSIKLWRVRKSHPGIKTRSYRSLKDRRSKLKSQPRSTLNETKRHWRKVKTISQSFKSEERWNSRELGNLWCERNWVNENNEKMSECKQKDKTKMGGKWSSEVRDLDSKEVERSRREPQSPIRKGRTRLW